MCLTFYVAVVFCTGCCCGLGAFWYVSPTFRTARPDPPADRIMITIRTAAKQAYRRASALYREPCHERLQHIAICPLDRDRALQHHYGLSRRPAPKAHHNLGDLIFRVVVHHLQYLPVFPQEPDGLVTRVSTQSANFTEMHALRLDFSKDLVRFQAKSMSSQSMFGMVSL